MLESMRGTESNPFAGTFLMRKAQLIEDLTLKDARATALTLLAKKVDILTLAKISRHKDMELLRSTYYRETAEEIARRI